MKLVPTHTQRRPSVHVSGYMLIECLVYMLVLFILLGVSYAAFYRCWENSVALRSNAEDITNALQAGERWRADFRSTTGKIRVEGLGAEQILHLPGARGEVAYQFSTNAVLRRVGSGPWVAVLKSVKSSTMESDARPTVAAWKWELELQPRSKKPVRVRPLFTFIGVPQKDSSK